MRDYLLLKDHSLPEWRSIAETSRAAQYRRLLRQADAHHDSLPPAQHPSDSITYIGTAAMNLALAFLLSNDSKYLDTARRWMQSAIDYPHWGKERMPDHDLDAAWLLFGLGLAYDWLKDDLPTTERIALRDKLTWHGHKLYQFALDNQDKWWSAAYWQNHNWICYGGLAIVARALQYETPAAHDWFARARDNFIESLALMPEDGSNYEGPVYWRYGIIWFLITADLLQQETSQKLPPSPFLNNTFFYRLYLSGPNLIDTANFGDCHDRRSAHSAAIYARLAGHYAIPEAQWLYHHFYRNGEWEREAAQGLVKPGLRAESGLEFLWYQPQATESPIAKLPLQRAFPDLGLLAMRASWDADAMMMAFKCGTPNGMKAWHSGHSLNRQRGWNTLSPGHDHPDANSFILLKGSDYLLVDDGYAKSKQTSNHSALLIDGQGQYADGKYNAFHDLDPSWGARLESAFHFQGITYARGEASRAYPKALKLRQYTRQILFLNDGLIILHDAADSDIPHEYAWLLQSDAPAKTISPRQFSITAGQTSCAIHALAPADFTHHIREQEITANPTSANPNWILRRKQYALAICPRKSPRSRFFAIIDLEGYTVESTPAARGNAATLTNGNRQWRIGFAAARDGIQTDSLNIDGAWFAGHWHDSRLIQYLAGDLTSIWLDDSLHCVADRPVQIGMRRTNEQLRFRVSAPAPTWLRFAADPPNNLAGHNLNQSFHYNEATGMAWMQVPAGTTDFALN